MAYPIQNLQAMIKKPIVDMISPSSSSIHQLALVRDQVECVPKVSEELAASNAVDITGNLHFVCGDKPAQQF